MLMLRLHMFACREALLQALMRPLSRSTHAAVATSRSAAGAPDAPEVVHVDVHVAR